MATRADIRGYARIRADQDSSTFPSDAQYDTLLDAAGRAVWLDLVKAGWPVYLQSASVSATGSGALAIGKSDLAFVAGVYRPDGAELKRLNEGDRAAFSRPGDPSHYAVSYDPTLGAVLELFPIPSTGTFRVGYVAQWPGFANDNSVWPGPAGSEELVGLRAAIMGMRKEGNDQGALQLRDEYVERLRSIQDMAGAFDLRNPPTIRDVHGGLSPARDPFDFEI